jgi:hypothetical protein
MGQEFDLPEGFSLRKSWPKSTADHLFQSIISDAVKDLGWKISKNNMTIRPPILKGTTQRKMMMQSILDTRVQEQQDDPAYRENLMKLKAKVLPLLFIPEDFPNDTESVIKLFSEVEVKAVVSLIDKEIFRYLRHSWRIPYKTTPGRTLSFLVRIGPEKKIAGIFSLASPAMWMSNRDETLGFENFDVLELSKANKNEVEIYIKKQVSKDSRLNKKELQQLKSEFTLSLQKPDWIERWRKNGLVDDIKKSHHLSGRFTVSELLNSCMQSIEKRILQFPIEAISDEEDFAAKCKSLGISIKVTKPTLWITGTEPNNNSTQEKRCEKRRRIVRECLVAYEQIHDWKREGFPVTVENLFGCLHESENPIWKERMTALKVGVRESKTSMISSNIAEMVICGSIPPLNSLRVGKLVAMLALSCETKEFWDSTYSTSSSLIATELAGRPISKTATLSAISTTGLYGRSNAQYDRISIPSVGGTKIRFPMVGVTGDKGEGPSNLMISDRSWNLVSKYIEENEIEGISGKFGEGTSARIRRLQKAIQLVDSEVTGGAKLKVSSLLKKIISNPFSRSIHVANLAHNSVRFHLGIDKSPSINDEDLSKDEILKIWRERWLAPLMSREIDGVESAIQKVKNCNIDNLLPPFN